MTLRAFSILGKTLSERVYSMGPDRPGRWNKDGTLIVFWGHVKGPAREARNITMLKKGK